MSDTSAMTAPQAAGRTDASADVSCESLQAKTENILTPSTLEKDVPSTSKENTSILNNTSDLSRTEMESSNEQEMLRKRRLQKFSPQPTTE